MLVPRRDEDTVCESVRFTSGPYRLEGELLYPEQAWPRWGVVLAGPHPLLGGTMDNNVIAGLAWALASRGLAALRFNYRGAGNSDGPALAVPARLAEFWATSRMSDEPAFRDDLIAAVPFLREQVGPARLALVGYSFGCSLLPHAGAGPAAPLVFIAPTVGIHDLGGFASGCGPLLVVASEGDFAVPAADLQAWFDRLPQPRQLLRGKFDNHFFRGHEGWLGEQVLAFLDTQGSKL
jgi:alpha/beta superfamily hydrolase